ncbi:MAG: ankyrin repeat domain-containing protein [Candidatus Hydrogenedentes bacterium]|nr:ankyrin repeat domain-containing protein [Candidatus Hydrogenedentota bacterium]
MANIDLTLMLFLALASFWVPPIQYGLRYVGGAFFRGLAVALIFFPGTVMTVFGTYFGAVFDDTLTWITVWKQLIGPAIGDTFLEFWVLTGFNLTVWEICTVILRHQCRSVGKPYVYTSRRAVLGSVFVVLIVTGIPTLYLYNYKTLQYAVEHGDLLLAEKRLQNNLLGVDANTGYITRSSSDDTVTEPLLPIAARRGDLEMVKLLLTHGADINRRGERIFRPVTEAVLACHYDVAEYLLEEGADPAEAMDYASRKNESDFLRLLLAHGGSPSLGLWEAVRCGRVEDLRLLLEHGATPLGIGGDGRTLLDVAGENETDECFQVLSHYTRDIRHPNEIIRSGTLSALELALGLGLDVNAEYPGRDGKPETMLACATRLGKQEFIDVLVKAGAKVDAGEASTQRDLPKGLR